MRRLFGKLWRLLDAILPRPWSEDELAPTEDEAVRRRRRLRLKRFEKSGHGGNR
jgi:hypothetical protein